MEVFLAAHRQAPPQIILDLYATDDPLHGNQEECFFHGHYSHYCYLPLYIFCGEFLLRVRLRPSNIDASAGSVEELQRIVKQIRAVWPQVRVVVRGSSGFCREELIDFDTLIWALPRIWCRLSWGESLITTSPSLAKSRYALALKRLLASAAGQLVAHKGARGRARGRSPLARTFGVSRPSGD